MSLLCKTRNWVCPHYNSDPKPTIEIKKISATNLFGFSSQSAFNDFCKRNLGMPPEKIRESIQSGRKD